MSHSLSKIWIHLIFGTKHRQPIITNSYESKLHEYIAKIISKDYQSDLLTINGTEDHIHILFALSPIFSLSSVVKGIKGDSSHWINSNSFIKKKFAWQVGYAAFSVSNSRLDIVEKYITKQKEHHRKKSYIEELNLLFGTNNKLTQ